jgi:predicted phosphodiesterase
MKTRVRLLSDLHLELNPNLKIDFKKQADVVILAGDIGNPFTEKYVTFLRLLSLEHSKVFILSGNHEYYNKHHNITEIDNKIRDICADEDENIHFLQMNSVIYNRIRFLGCTLWSKPTDKTLCKYMNDFKFITFEDYVKMHDTHREWLENELTIKDELYDKACVITHHIPKYHLLDDEYKDSPINSFFVTDINTNGADVWCYGHTHKFNYKKDDNIEYHCNPHGYTNENLNPNPDYIFEI